jgi:hypothetical protein
MISTSSSRPAVRAASDSQQAPCLAQRFRVFRVIEAQALDDMRHRPFGEVRAEVFASNRRVRARLLTGREIQKIVIGGAEQRSAIGPVEQHEARAHPPPWSPPLPPAL